MKVIKEKKIYKNIILFSSSLIILNFLYTFTNNYLYLDHFIEKNRFYDLAYIKNEDKYDIILLVIYLPQTWI